MAEQRVDYDLKIIGVIERHIAHDQPVDDAKGVIGNKQNRTVSGNISKRTGIAVERNIGEFECFAEEGLSRYPSPSGAGSASFHGDPETLQEPEQRHVSADRLRVTRR